MTDFTALIAEMVVLAATRVGFGADPHRTRECHEVLTVRLGEHVVRTDVWFDSYVHQDRFSVSWLTPTGWVELASILAGDPEVPTFGPTAQRRAQREQNAEIVTAALLYRAAAILDATR